MDKNEVIKILLNEQTCVKTADTCDRDCAKCPLVMDSEKIIEAYNLAIKLLSEQQWIPCSDHTPDSPIRVMAQLENEWIITAWYDDEEEKWYSVPPQYDDHDCWLSLEDIGYTVLAWMPLPEPWRGEEP